MYKRQVWVVSTLPVLRENGDGEKKIMSHNNHCNVSTSSGDCRVVTHLDNHV